jgi:anti-sigma28 factor (negative regulator of flagellin synthesis)
MMDKTTQQQSRQARVEDLRRRIAAGTYVVCADRLAERLLRAAQSPPSSFWVH